MVVVAQLAVDEPRAARVRVAVVAEHRDADLAAAEVPVDVERLGVPGLPRRGCSRSHHHGFCAGVATPTWFGTMSTRIPSPAACAASASRARRLGAARAGSTWRVVDDVVAVVGPRLGLQQRRQVQPVDAELARGSRRGRRRRRGRSRADLQPVGRARDAPSRLHSGFGIERSIGVVRTASAPRGRRQRSGRASASGTWYARSTTSDLAATRSASPAGSTGRSRRRRRRCRRRSPRRASTPRSAG